MAEIIPEFKSKAVLDFFEKISNNIDDIESKDKEFWRIIQSISFRDVIDHFKKQRGPDGKWEKWSDAYAAHMAKIGKSGNKILQDTGRLRQSILFIRSNTDIRKGEVLFNPTEYAKKHDEGLGNMPKRQFFWYSQKALRNISKTTLGYILNNG